MILISHSINYLLPYAPTQADLLTAPSLHTPVSAFSLATYRTSKIKASIDQQPLRDGSSRNAGIPHARVEPCGTDLLDVI